MKYFLCIVVIALASQASAQLRCFTCTNCANPSNPINCAHPPPPTDAPTTLPPGPPTEPPIVPPIIPTTLVPTPPTPPATLPPLTPITPGPPVQDPTPPVTPITPPATPPLTPPAPEPAQTEATTNVDPDFASVHDRKRRSVQEVDPFRAHFSCFRVHVQVGTATHINRGCIANGGSNNQTCWRAAGGTGLQQCELCSGNDCNSSSGLISSVFLVLASAFVVLRMY